MDRGASDLGAVSRNQRARRRAVPRADDRHASRAAAIQDRRHDLSLYSSKEINGLSAHSVTGNLPDCGDVRLIEYEADAQKYPQGDAAEPIRIGPSMIHTERARQC